MVDRATRQTVIFKLPGQTQYSVDRALNGLERELGAEGFRKTFKTITVDHGSEFLDSATLEQSVLSNQPQTTIYYTHPNSLWERGSNKNGNGFIRYFIPKEHHIGDDSKEEIGNLSKQMKEYPRKILGGKSANAYALSCS